LNKLLIKCNAINCANRDYDTGYCGYKSGTQIDIDSNGVCLDYDRLYQEDIVSEGKSAFNCPPICNKCNTIHKVDAPCPVNEDFKELKT